jgi:hypothetical protein
MDKKQATPPSSAPSQVTKPNDRTSLLVNSEQNLEALQLAVAAYSAKDIKALLADPAQNEPALTHGLTRALISGGDFTPAQAGEFSRRYAPVAALDDAGAGAVIFRDRQNAAVLIGVRGTDAKGNLANDAKADAILALGHLPLDQTTRITNFVLQHTTPEDQRTVQLGVKGVHNASDDLARAYIVNKFGYQAVTALQEKITGKLATPFDLVVAGHVPGTGLATGTCRLASGHSEGGAEILVANGVMGCGKVTTYNAPHAPIGEMQSFVNQTTRLAQLPHVTLSEQPMRRLAASGPSVVNGLHSPPGTEQQVLPIAPTKNPFTAHSSATGMNAAELKLALIRANPHITTDEQANTLLAHTHAQSLQPRPTALQGGVHLQSGSMASVNMATSTGLASVMAGTPLLTAALASHATAFARQQGFNDGQTQSFFAALGQAALRRDGNLAGPQADTKAAHTATVAGDISYNDPKLGQALSR